MLLNNNIVYAEGVNAISEISYTSFLDLSSLIYLGFSSLAIVSAVMVIGATNPVHSVLFLVLVFASVSGLLFLLGAELLAMLFVIVYVGAIAILFLFVVMMLPTHGKRATGQLVSTYVPLTLILVISFCLSVILQPLFKLTEVTGWVSSASVTNYLNQTSTATDSYVASIEGLTNLDVLGRLLYTEFSGFFLVAGLILLVAMIGAIVLTMHRRGDIRRQEPYEQIARDFRDTIVSIK